MFSWVKILKSFTRVLLSHNEGDCPERLSWRPRMRNSGRGMAEGGITAHFAAMKKAY